MNFAPSAVNFAPSHSSRSSAGDGHVQVNLAKSVSFATRQGFANPDGDHAFFIPQPSREFG